MGRSHSAVATGGGGGGGGAVGMLRRRYHGACGRCCGGFGRSNAVHRGACDEGMVWDGMNRVPKWFFVGFKRSNGRKV